MKISYSKKEIKNLGNYENVTIEMSAEYNVNFDIETKDDAFYMISNFVNTKLKEQFNDIISTPIVKNSQIKCSSPTSSPHVSPEVPQISLDDIKDLIRELIAKNPNNRNIIKEKLAKFDVTKIQDLNPLLQSEFYESLTLITG
jgi:serine/threonine protein kinase